MHIQELVSGIKKEYIEFEYDKLTAAHNEKK